MSDSAFVGVYYALDSSTLDPAPQLGLQSGYASAVPSYTLPTPLAAYLESGWLGTSALNLAQFSQLLLKLRQAIEQLEAEHHPATAALWELHESFRRVRQQADRLDSELSRAVQRAPRARDQADDAEAPRTRDANDAAPPPQRQLPRLLWSTKSQAEPRGRSKPSPEAQRREQRARTVPPKPAPLLLELRRSASSPPAPQSVAAGAPTPPPASSPRQRLRNSVVGRLLRSSSSKLLNTSK